MKRSQKDWEERWNDSDFALHWTAEMFAYMFSAARAGIRHSISSNLQDQLGQHSSRLAPLIHYSAMIRLSNGVSWGKGMPDADGEPMKQLLSAVLPADVDEVVSGASTIHPRQFSPLIRCSIHRLLAPLSFLHHSSPFRH